MIGKPTLERACVFLHVDTISWTAKAVFLYCCTQQEDWKLTVEELVIAGMAGPDAIYAAIKQLKNVGLLVMTRQASGAVEYCFGPAAQR